jgi:hypothetical protein
MRVCQDRITEDIPFQCEPTRPVDIASIGRALLCRLNYLDIYSLKKTKAGMPIFGSQLEQFVSNDDTGLLVYG